MPKLSKKKILQVKNLSVCPECNAKNALRICRDSISIFKIGSSKPEGHNDLDERWLECSGCGGTSEEKPKLKARLDQIDTILY